MPHIALKPPDGNGRTSGGLLLDELCGHIRDVLARDGLSLTQMIEVIEDRTAGAPDEQLFRAAALVLREQGERISELTAAVGERDDIIARREDEIADREIELESLRGGRP